MKREKWTRQEWVLTVAFLIMFPPVGIAAVIRWAFGQRVWQ
jgi:hypothetical protein